MKINAIKSIKLIQQQTESFEDFYGFLTADNITLKMTKRAKKCAENNSKIVWIEGEAGTGKNLLTQAIIQQYKLKQNLAPSPNIVKITEPQFDYIEQYMSKDTLIIRLMQNCSKDCLIKLQQQLISITMQPKNTPSLIAIITYPSSLYSSSAAKQISNMRQIFINEQYEYMMLQPLRNRIHDIELLTKHYLRQFQQILNLPAHLQLDEAMMANVDILQQHKWAGNVKELQQYCLLMCQIFGGEPLEREAIIHALSMVNDKHHDNIAPTRPKLSLIKNPQIGSSNTNISLLNTDGKMKQFIELEYEIIAKACRYYRGSKSNAAKELGVGRTTLYRKLSRED